MTPSPLSFSMRRPIAQLVEFLSYKQAVKGSSPFGSNWFSDWSRMALWSRRTRSCSDCNGFAAIKKLSLLCRLCYTKSKRVRANGRLVCTCAHPLFRSFFSWQRHTFLPFLFPSWDSCSQLSQWPRYFYILKKNKLPSVHGFTS